MTPEQSGRRGSRRGRYLPFAAQADAALLERSLTEQQRDRLLAWAGTHEAAAGGVENIVESHTVSLKADTWRDLLKDAPDLLQAATKTGGISRKDVTAVATSSADTDEWVPLLNASYAWGQGRNGYGPSRLRAIHAGAASAGVDIETTLNEAVDTMRAGTAVDAYARLDGAIPDLGPAFFTKFLYFAGTRVAPASGPAPLVLDAVVAGRLASLTAARAAAAGLPDPDGLSSWLWTNTDWSPYRYGVWLDYAQAATRQLVPRNPEEHAWPDRADLVELALFQGIVN